MPSFVFPLLYVVDVFFCIRSIKNDNSRQFAVTKTLLMMLLIGSYFSLLPDDCRGMNRQAFVALALGFHNLGDICLLFPKTKSHKMFYIGMVAFFVGHVFYTLWFAMADVGHTALGALIVVVILLVLEYLFLRFLMNGYKKYVPVFIPYSLGLGALAVAIASTFGGFSPFYATVVALLGVSSFIYSDYCLARRTLKMPFPGQMVVMSTYIGAQTFLVAGMLLLQI